MFLLLYLPIVIANTNMFICKTRFRNFSLSYNISFNWWLKYDL